MTTRRWTEGQAKPCCRVSVVCVDENDDVINLYEIVYPVSLWVGCANMHDKILFDIHITVK